MTDHSKYDIRLDVAYEALERFDVGALAGSVEPWFNQTLVSVNDSVLRLGVIHGEFHWHHHDGEDELFYVVDGKLLVDLEPTEDGAPGRTVTLDKGQGIVVPKNVEHRTRAPERTVILMAAGAGVQPTGDA